MPIRHMCFVMMGVFLWASAAFGNQSYASENFKSIERFYNAVRIDNMREEVLRFYDPSIKFVDPLGTLQGTESLIKYYSNLYENVIDINFQFHKYVQQGDIVMATWTMKVKHKKIRSGEEITVDGVSHIEFKNGKAVFHQDYFDAGAMLYENIPILGWLVRKVKARAGQH